MSELIETAPLWVPGTLLMACLILASGLFSGSETALFYLSRDDLRRMLNGTAGERMAASLMRNPDRLLTVVLFWNLLINLAYFAVSIVVAKRLVDSGHSALAGLISVGGLVSIILFGEVAPKSLAVVFRKQIAVWASWPLAIAVRVLEPVLPFLNMTTQGLLRGLWPRLEAEPYLEVDDIERAVEYSELGVELIHVEQQMLRRILDLSDMKAEELMRPRGSFPTLSIPVSLADLQALDPLPDYLLMTDPHDETVRKALAIKDLTALPETNIEKSAEDVVFIPWCGSASDALSQLRHRVMEVACVVNEYGETVGILTEDDLVDTIFNPTSSRTRRVVGRDPIEKTKSGWKAAGLTTLRYLGERLGCEYEPGNDGLLTIAALLHEELERFPVIGDQCVWQGFRLTVTHAGERGESIQVLVEPISNSAG